MSDVFKELFRCTDYIPVPSASRAGPLKSGSSVRRAWTVSPTQDCATPEGSVPPKEKVPRRAASDPYRDLGTDRERASQGAQKTRVGRFLSAVRKATIRCGGGFGLATSAQGERLRPQGRSNADERHVSADREVVHFESWVHRALR